MITERYSCLLAFKKHLSVGLQRPSTVLPNLTFYQLLILEDSTLGVLFSRGRTFRLRKVGPLSGDMKLYLQAPNVVALDELSRSGCLVVSELQYLMVDMFRVSADVCV